MTIEEMLESLVKELDIEGSALSKWERNFIGSVNEQFELNKSLTEKQESVIERIFSKMF